MLEKCRNIRLRLSTVITFLINLLPTLSHKHQFKLAHHEHHHINEFDRITLQFRMKSHEMSTMSTTKITPNYTTIKDFDLFLRKNALAIPSHQTHLGHLGHLVLVISPEEFVNVNGNRPFIEPANHGMNAAR